MTKTRGELKGTVLRFLNKTSRFRGFYDDAKCNDAIQEALDYIAEEMMDASSGWQTKVGFYDTQAGQVTFPISPTVAMIKEVRYKFGDIYVPLNYDDETNVARADPVTSQERQIATKYSIIDNQLFFNPALSDGGEKFLMVEYYGYPKELLDDNDVVEGHFDRTMAHFLKYKVASILSASIEKEMRPWATEEAQWQAKMLRVLHKRVHKAIPIKPFGLF